MIAMGLAETSPDPLSAVDSKRTRHFAPDEAAHRRDRPRWCPLCQEDLATAGAVTEYWASDQRIFYVWCGACGWTGELTPLSSRSVTGHGLTD